MNLKKLSCAAVVLAATSQTASAYYIPNQPDKGRGYYIYAGLGASSLSDSAVKVTSTGASGDESFDLGAIMTSGAGYRFPNNGFRAELEYAHRRNDIDKAPSFITPDENAEQDYSSNSIMANLIYEFREGKRTSPYIGAGAGYTFLKNGGDADQQFAYQGIAGAFFKVMDDIDFSIAYKYFSTFDTPEMSVKATPSPLKTDYPYTAHSIEVRGILNF